MKSSLVFSFASDKHLTLNIVMNLSVTKQLHVILRYGKNCTRLLLYGMIKLNCYLRLIVNNSIIL